MTIEFRIIDGQAVEVGCEHCPVCGEYVEVRMDTQETLKGFQCIHGPKETAGDNNNCTCGVAAGFEHKDWCGEEPPPEAEVLSENRWHASRK